MLNRKAVVVTEDWHIHQELRALGLTPEIVRNVAVAAASARDDALEVDPISTPGTLAYIHGVRSVRLQTLPLGWRVSRAGNVESTVNDELGIQLCFQNVDQACGERDPEAISGKGSGSRNLINAGQQGELWEKEESRPLGSAIGATPTVWVICVSTDGTRLKAEVSCPEVFQGNQFEGFSKRILVVDESFEPGPSTGERGDDDDGSADPEVRIAKK